MPTTNTGINQLIHVSQTSRQFVPRSEWKMPLGLSRQSINDTTEATMKPMVTPSSMQYTQDFLFIENMQRNSASNNQ